MAVFVAIVLVLAGIAGSAALVGALVHKMKDSYSIRYSYFCVRHTPYTSVHWI